MSVISSIGEDVELTCKPLNTYNEILMFLQDPPAWRSLCKEIQPHSKRLIKNKDIKRAKNVSRVFQDGPETFCHFDPGAEDVERHDEECLPKTLVCHDMANGYHDDCYIDGTGNFDAYTFYNWAGIDIFCYFSHHLITIPPLGWINVGHAHGVKVIGTVITEWAEGLAFWDKILESESEYKNFASALVAIAKTLKFDGWLLNIENKIMKPDVLLEFVKHLHTILHQELKDPVLIWYDSVTIEGHLNWQNALNHKNKDFFDICDGFFTNYSWTEMDVISSAKEAGERKTDLFIGIDVWGRNFYGGGQFNIQQAVDVAFCHGCSLAIFAPAWSHEAITTDPSDINTVVCSDHLHKYEQFMLRDRALWDSIWDFLNTKLPCSLPFKTSFCRGQGKKRRLYGEVLCPVPWYNLRHMQYQPNSSHGPHGYFLSTIERIVQASQHGVIKNSTGKTKGIIKYQETNILSYIDLQTVKSVEIVERRFIQKSDSISGVREETAEPQQNAIEKKTESKQKGLKRKIKNFFKHVFREKTSETKNEIKEPEKGPKFVEKQMRLETRQDQNNENNLDFTNGDKRGVVLQDLVNYDNQEKEVKRELSDVDDDDDDIESKPITIPMVQMSINIKLKDPSEKTRYALACVREELQCLEAYFEDSFIGGSCLKVNPSDLLSPERRLIRIFHCDFFCENALIVCVATKHLRGFEDQFLNIKFNMRDAKDAKHRIVLIGRDLPHAQRSEEGASYFVNLYPILSSYTEFKDIQKYLLLNDPDFYVPVENSYKWIVRYYEIHLPESRVTSINCETGLDEGPILLGHLGICPRLRDPKSE